jgi:hypothetical protein
MRHAWKLILAGIVVVVALLALQEPEERKPPAQAEAPQPRPGRKAVGKTTQKVLDLAAALADGAMLVDNESEPDEAGLAAYGQAYRHSVARIGGIAVEQKLRLYQAEHDEVPATHAEFMAKIIAPGSPDEVQLPKLPPYQDYAFDPRTRRLVVVEFPARKAAP